VPLFLLSFKPLTPPYPPTRHRRRCVGRDLARTIIVDNSPHSYAFHPENAVPVSSFIDDPSDAELLDCMEVLLAAEAAGDVRAALPALIARKQAGLPLLGPGGGGGGGGGGAGS
jgi:hypothetical protein